MSKKLTKEMLFNFVAPIHIYFKADLLYKPEAIKGFKSLKRYKDDKLVKEYFRENISVLSLPVSEIDNINYKIFWRIYDELFEDIVLEKFPFFIPAHEYYGAKCFKYNGKIYLDGDDYDCYPYYLDRFALDERLIELKKELAQNA